MQSCSLTSDVSTSVAEAAIGDPQLLLEYRVAERTKSLAEEALVLADQATVLAEQASERVRSLAAQATVLARQATVLAEQAELLDLTHDSIIVRDRNNQITFWNQGAARTYGWSAEKALGRVTHGLLKTQFPLPLEQIEASLLAQGYWEGELVHTRANQTTLIVASRWALQRDGEGKPRGILEINNDITERKHAEASLRLSEERLGLLTQGNKSQAIFMLDPKGLVATWNDGAQWLSGYTSTEIIGRHFSQFFTAEAILQREPAEILRVASEQGHCEIEGWRVRKDGSRFWASVVINALRDKTGELRGFGKVTRDFTDRKQAEMLLEDARQEQLRFKDEFLSHVSHELRSPLAAIESFSSIIADGLAGVTTQEQDRYLQIISKNAAQLQSMVEDLLEVTRGKSGQLRIDIERVSVSRALVDAFNTFEGAAAAKGVKFTSIFTPDLPDVSADATRLLQVLIILCDNAIKFTPAGGTVKVEAGVFEMDPRFLLVQVSDTGCGINAKSIKRIFEHHYQESELGSLGRRGLGLGLHIAKTLVGRQGGQIWVNSEPQRGSTFSFTVPIFSMSAEAEAAHLPAVDLLQS